MSREKVEGKLQTAISCRSGFEGSGNSEAVKVITCSGSRSKNFYLF